MPKFTGKNSIVQTDYLLKDDAVNATAVPDVFGGSAVVHNIHIINAGAVCWLKFYDHADPTVGTTDPDIILQADGSEEVVWTIIDGISFTNFSYAAVSAAGTGGTGNPGGGNIDIFMVVR
tara:strand:- start:580 stop:939 length:360 start_codon:yes stop_codon:yes gene_type:complete